MEHLSPTVGHVSTRKRNLHTKSSPIHFISSTKHLKFKKKKVKISSKIEISAKYSSRAPVDLATETELFDGIPSRFCPVH